MTESRDPMIQRVDPADRKPGMRPENKVGIGCMSLIGAAVIGLIIAMNTEPEPEPPDPWSAVERVCKSHVLDRLKSPSTAEFGEVDVSTSGPPYSVRGVVDAQNSFGASLRNSYSCVVTRGSSGWELVSFNLS